MVTISSIENAFGVATINVIATDSSGASSTQPFTLTVNAVNDIPQLLSGLLVRTYAGSGNSGSDNGTIHQASFTQPYGIAVVNDGNVVISENNFALRIINPNSGTVSDYSAAAFQEPAGLDFSPTIGGVSAYSRPGVFLAERPRNRVRRYDSVFRSALASFENFTPYNRPRDVAYDADNRRLFVADTDNHRIQVIEDITQSSLRASVYAGSSAGTAGAIDGTATAARFRSPTSIALAPDGRLFVTDSGNNLIRVISTDGTTVSTYAGDASPGTIDYLDGSTSTARFNLPYGIAVATDGRVFVADRDNHSIRLIDAEGSTVSTYAGGNGNESVINGLASNATFNNPTSIAIDAQGRVLVTDLSNHLIRSIEQGSLEESVSEPFLSAAEQTTGAIVLDAATIQGLFIDADSDTLTYSLSNNNAQTFFAISSTNGAITLAAIPLDGHPRESILTITASDQHGAATASISVLLEDRNDPPTFTLSTSRLDLNEDFGRREVTITSSDDGDIFATQTLSYSLSHSADSVEIAIDPQSGTITIISIPNANSTNTISVIATDSSGGVSMQTLTIAVAPVADPLTAVQSVRAVSTYAGDGNRANDNGSTTTASFNNPYGIVVATDGRLFVSDQDGHQIRLIDSIGSTVSTYSGRAGNPGADQGDIGARYRQPTGLARTANNFLYIADRGNHCIRFLVAASVSANTGDLANHFSGVCGDANASSLSEPRGVALNPANGRLFVADSNNHRIRLLSTGGDITNSIGDGISGFADGSAATARFNTPVDVVVAPDGRVFVADSNNHRIRVISADGSTVSTYAGEGISGFVDGSSATALFDTPSGLALAEDGRLFVVDRNNHSIRVISADGNTVSTYAGDGSSGINNAFGDAARFNNPLNAAIDADGRLFVTDSANHLIRLIEDIPITRAIRINESGQLANGVALNAQTVQSRFQDPDDRDLEYSIIAGNQDGVFSINNETGAITFVNPAVEQQAGTHTLTIQANDDSDSATNTITLFLEPLDNYPPIFTLSTTALTLTEDFESAVQVSVVNPSDGDSGVEQTLTYSAHTDDVLAAIAIDLQSGTITLNSVANAFGETAITVVATDSSGASRARVLNLSITPVADPVVPAPILIARTYAGSGSQGSNDGAALEASFNLPYGIAVAPDGRVFVSENSGNLIRMISADGATVSTYAGDGSTNVLNQPAGLSLAPDGRLFIADSGNNRIRMVSADATTLSTYAEGGLNSPRAVALNADGRLFIADFSNHLIRTVSPDGTISTYAGDSTAAFNNGSTATAQFNFPADLAVRPNGSLLVADRDNHRIRSINAGNVSTFAGNGETEVLNQPFGIALAADGGVFVLDRTNHRIRLLSRDGSALNTYAGSGVAGFKEGLALEAQFNNPTHIATAPDGRLLVVDFANHRIRVIEESTNAITLRTVSASEQEAGSTLFQAQTLFINVDGDDLNYRLISVSNDGGAIFTIDSDNGRISPLTAPMESQAGTYTLVIEASNAAGPTTAAVVISLQPLDNYPPIFTLSTTTANIKQGEDTLQISVTASDDGDSGVDQAITYSISRSNVNFATLTINENSGLITISNVPDAFGRRATVSVTATDSSGASSVQSIVIRGYIISRFAQSASVYAGSGAFGSDDGSTTTARFDTPRGLALAADGRLFVADSANDRHPRN